MPAGEVVILIALKIGDTVSQNGRVPVELFEPGTWLKTKKYSLKVESIEKITYYRGKYYIAYKTENADFYKQNFRTSDELKGEPCHFYTGEAWVCGRCGAEIGTEEWDMGECLECGAPSTEFKKVGTTFVVARPRREWRPFKREGKPPAEVASFLEVAELYRAWRARREK